MFNSRGEHSREMVPVLTDLVLDTGVLGTTDQLMSAADLFYRFVLLWCGLLPGGNCAR